MDLDLNWNFKTCTPWKIKLKNIVSELLGSSWRFLLRVTNWNLAPTNKFTDLNYWTSAEKASAVLNMGYSQMFSASYFFANERLSDNLYEGRGNSDEKIITSGQADAALGRFANEWRNCYEGIKNLSHLPGKC